MCSRDSRRMKLTLDDDILYLIPEDRAEIATLDLISERAILKDLVAWTESGALLVRIQSVRRAAKEVSDHALPG